MASAAYRGPCLETLAREAAFKLKRSAEYRTSASLLLAECKRRVDAGDPESGGITWAEYCRAHFAQHRPGQIADLIEAALLGQDDVICTPQNDFDRAWSAFVALKPHWQHAFLRCGTAHLARRRELGVHAELGSHAAILDYTV